MVVQRSSRSGAGCDDRTGASTWRLVCVKIEEKTTPCRVLVSFTQMESITNLFLSRSDNKLCEHSTKRVRNERERQMNELPKRKFRCRLLSQTAAFKFHGDVMSQCGKKPVNGHPLCVHSESPRVNIGTVLFMWFCLFGQFFAWCWGARNWRSGGFLSQIRLAQGQRVQNLQ